MKVANELNRPAGKTRTCIYAFYHVLRDNHKKARRKIGMVAIERKGEIKETYMLSPTQRSLQNTTANIAPEGVYMRLDDNFFF